MSLHSPVEFAQIVDSYINGWRKPENGWMPECHSNNEVRKSVSIYFVLLTILIGSSGDNIVSHFAVNYHNEAKQLDIDLNGLYAALSMDGELNPPEWNIEGRQVNMYKWVIEFLYVFF